MSLAAVTRVPAFYDLSGVLRDGVIRTLAMRPDNRLVCDQGPKMALAKAEALRAEEITFHRGEIECLQAQLDDLARRRNEIRGLLNQSAGEIQRLASLQFRLD